MLLVQLLVVALVAWGIWHNVQKAVAEVQSQNFSFSELRWPWMALGGALYVAASLPMALFWIRLMRSMGQQPDTYGAVRAFFIGHLGKYVPGKALVVVLRTTLATGKNLERSVVATAVFAETLTMVAVGAVFSAVFLALWFADQRLLLVLAMGIALAASCVTIPDVFRAIVLWLKVSRINPEIESKLAGLNYRVMGFGWCANLVAWCLMSASLWAVLQSIPQVSLGESTGFSAIPVVAATVSLAMVVGFVTPIPGGMGVREFVIMEIMGPVFGAPVAVISAVLLRIAWLLAELLTAIILYVIPPRTAAENHSIESPR